MCVTFYQLELCTQKTSQPDRYYSTSSPLSSLGLTDAFEMANAPVTSGIGAELETHQSNNSVI
jgi:hypothetical protein